MFQLPKPPTFTGHAAPGVPAPHTARAKRRFAAMLREAAAIVDRLPGPGESLHFLLSGTYDLATMLGYLVTSRNVPCLEMVLVTLAFSSRNTHELTRLVDAGAVVKLSLLCSDFHRKHSPAIFEEARQEFSRRGMTLAVARCHAKVALLHFGDGLKLVMETSANLRTNSNTEFATLYQDAGLWEFHRDWILAKHHEHEVQQGGIAPSH